MTCSRAHSVRLPLLVIPLFFARRLCTQAGSLGGDAVAAAVATEDGCLPNENESSLNMLQLRARRTTSSSVSRLEALRAVLSNLNASDASNSSDITEIAAQEVRQSEGPKVEGLVNALIYLLTRAMDSVSAADEDLGVASDASEDLGAAPDLGSPLTAGEYDDVGGASATPAAPRRSVGAGEVSGLFTFGCPGTAKEPFRNPLRSNGTFPGLRVFTQLTKHVFGIAVQFHDPISFAADVAGLKHAEMDYMVLESGAAPKVYPASRAAVTLPATDLAFWITGHDTNTYISDFAKFLAPYDEMADDMLILSRAVYPNYNPTPEAIAKAVGAVGWNLVARSMSEHLPQDSSSDFGIKSMISEDYITLFQHNSTLACAIAFVGTHDITQWIANMDFHTGEYCGLQGVHKGFLEQVKRATDAHDYGVFLKPALNSCTELYVTGHSLGAAQAEVFTACIQNAPALGEPGWQDYEAIGWRPPEKPTLLKPMV